ncbi:MAG: NAD(+) synthase [Candidatus Chisholmbacteria bacterium]|nr:NAD(+) synthase [Candidatus Chisholmbacteria bacterium]
MASLLPSIRAAAEVKKITAFIKFTLKSTRRSKLVMASSGGIDSSTTLSLATKAVGPTRISIVKLPYGPKYPQAEKFTDSIAKYLKIPKRNVFAVDISLSVERIWKSILIELSRSQTGQSKLTNLIRLGNIMARVRMIFMYDMAKAQNALVLGTENKSEHLLGYYTRFGDEASDLEPIRHLFKTQVRDLAEFLKLPEDIRSQAPTAGLWQGQTDQGELGFSYKTADQVLYLRFDKKLTPAQITTKLSQQNKDKPPTHWKKLVTKVLKRVEENEFKHHLPYHL